MATYVTLSRLPGLSATQTKMSRHPYVPRYPATRTKVPQQGLWCPELDLVCAMHRTAKIAVKICLVQCSSRCHTQHGRVTNVSPKSSHAHIQHGRRKRTSDEAVVAATDEKSLAREAKVDPSCTRLASNSTANTPDPDAFHFKAVTHAVKSSSSRNVALLFANSLMA